MPAQKKTNRKNTKTNTARKQQERAPKRREIGGFVCLLMGFFTVLAYWIQGAWLIDLLRQVLSGLFGWGFFLVGPILFAIAFILGFHRGRPVRLRMVAAALFPVLMGAMIHLVRAEAGGTEAANSMWVSLWQTGQDMQSGGVVSGLLSNFFESMASSVGAGILFILSMIFMLLITCNITITDIADWFKNREHLEYPEYEPEERPDPVAHPIPDELRGKRAGRPARKASIDIPLDGEERAKAPANMVKAEEKPAKKKGFGLRKPEVITPDKFWQAAEAGAIEDVIPSQNLPEQSGFSKSFDIPLDDASPVLAAPVVVKETVPQAAAIVQEQPKTVEEPAIQIGKIKPEETARAREEVAKEIAENLQEEQRGEYVFPPLSLLKEAKAATDNGQSEIAKNVENLNAALTSFRIGASIVNVTRGPSITRYELELEAGVKLNKLTNAADDLALSLGVSGVMIAPIPNKIATVGIEVPNKTVTMVSLREVLESENFTKPTEKLTFALGKDISGSCMVGNIAKLPHLLIAGTTGSGKSVTMNSLILSILYKAKPDEVKFIMIDPKMVEFGAYNGIPHLLIPVVTDPKKAAGALQWAVTEMLKRYKLFSETGSQNLESYNRAAEESDEMQVFPQLVVVIDELADLMLVASKEVEESICRIAQMGRASGIHLVIATQRPSADVITGLMKANIPSRIALSVSAALDSRIIMDTMGAEKLVGNGDMLYKPIGANKPTRIQGTYVSEKERERVIAHLKESAEAEYDNTVDTYITQAAAGEKGGGSQSGGGIDDDYDEMFGDAVAVLLDLGQASVSVLQRKLKLGYSRAARLMDQLEEAGVVGPFEGSKPRAVLVSREQWQAMQAGGEAPAAEDQTFEDIPRDDFSDLAEETEETESVEVEETTEVLEEEQEVL